MTIQQLQYALAVYRAGSISGAAANLFIAQPNLSGIIRSLEEELGYPIFVRTSRGVQPTERGMQALRQAAQMVSCHEKMCQLGTAMPRERFRIGGVAYTPVCDAFVKLCQEYQDDSNLEISYYSDDASTTLERLLMSELDMAIGLCNPDAADKVLRQCRQQGISLTHIVNVPLVLRIGPKHPLYNAPEIHLSDFQDYTMVDYNSRVFLDYPSLTNLLKINPDRVITVSDRSLKNMLISQTTMYGLGCKLPPVTNQRFQFRCIPLEDLHYSLFLMERKEGVRSKMGQRFLELMKETFENL